LGIIADRKYWIRLNATIQHFNMPIDIWAVGDAANKGMWKNMSIW
jgi:hypothetical protein